MKAKDQAAEALGVALEELEEGVATVLDGQERLRHAERICRGFTDPRIAAYDKFVAAMKQAHENWMAESKILTMLQLDGQECVVCGKNHRPMVPLPLLETSLSSHVFRCDQAACEVDPGTVQGWIDRSEPINGKGTAK